MRFDATSWQPQVRGLNQDGQAQARANAKRRLDESGYTPEQQAAAEAARARPPPAAAASPGSPPMETPAPKRRHRATQPQFKYLPPGFEIGTAEIGPVQHEGTASVGRRPVVPVLWPPNPEGGPGRTRIYDSLTGTTYAGVKCNKPSKTWVASQQAYAEEYATTMNYTTKDGAPPAHAPRARASNPTSPTHAAAAPPQADPTRMPSSTTR